MKWKLNKWQKGKFILLHMCIQVRQTYYSLLSTHFFRKYLLHESFLQSNLLLWLQCPSGIGIFYKVIALSHQHAWCLNRLYIYCPSRMGSHYIISHYLYMKRASHKGNNQLELLTRTALRSWPLTLRFSGSQTLHSQIVMWPWRYIYQNNYATNISVIMFILIHMTFIC